MSNYYLVEKCNPNQFAVVYYVKKENEVEWIYRLFTCNGQKVFLLMGSYILENHRGWTFETAQMNGIYKKVFLSRGRFRKFDKSTVILKRLWTIHDFKQ